MLAGLGAAGLSWREADALIDGTPELAFEAVQAAHAEAPALAETTPAGAAR
jgi:hypothetical protein